MFRRNCFFALLGLVFAVVSAFSDEAQECREAFHPQAIINASYRGDLKIIKEILDAGVDKDVRDALGATALHEAMFQPNFMVVKLLLDNGFDPNARTTRNGYTPLHIAVAANNVAAAKLLLQYGADKRIRCSQGLTPLDKARQSDKGALISLLR
jgi:ankyrin repeat protein